MRTIAQFYNQAAERVAYATRRDLVPARLPLIMFILYLDDAGSVGSANERHFILSGICVFERQIHYLSQSLDALAAQICPQDPDALEFHGSHILPGKGFWRSIKNPQTRRSHFESALKIAGNLRGDWALFGVVVEKQAVAGEDPVAYAFEQIISRFDTYLKRLHRGGKTHRGLIVLDKSTHETRLQILARDFRKNGSHWGSVTNLADVPMFVDSTATRAIQFADLVSYALWQNYEKNDPTFFQHIRGQFDSEGGIVHGLHHRHAAAHRCTCPACCGESINMGDI